MAQPEDGARTRCQVSACHTHARRAGDRVISRRDALAYLLVAPAASWAQPAPGMHRIGPLTGGTGPDPEGRNFPAFLESMRKLGYEEGRNVVYEHRFAQ